MKKKGYKRLFIILIILEVLLLIFSFLVLKYQFGWFGGCMIEPWMCGNSWSGCPPGLVCTN
jgi:hypothetical protein